LTVVRWAEKVPLNLNRIMPAKGACNSVSFFSGTCQPSRGN